MPLRLPDRIKTLACAAALFGVNLYVCRELFRIEYLNQMASIEAAFISLARYITQNARDLTWFPLWYNGVPYQNTYPPLLHWTVALLATISHWSPALSYHAVIATLYCLAPVTLFLLCLAFSGSHAYSFFAALLYSLLSPSTWVIAHLRQEIGLLRPRRLQTLLVMGEGPHLAGLVLLPLAILMLHRAVTRRRMFDVVLCSVLFAATALTNWLAAVALFAGALAYLASMKNLRAAPIAIPMAALAYAMAMPWMPPSTIRMIRINAPYLGGFHSVYGSMPLNLTVLSIAVIAVVLAMRRITSSLALRFAAIFSFLTAALVVPAVYWQIYIVPQPERYHLELELGLAMLVVFAARPLLSRAPRKLQIAIAVALLAAAILPAKSDRRYARFLLSPIDVTQTIEYKTAVWLGQNLPGRRVFAPGSTMFWMNAFNDSPQLGGGFDNGLVNQSTRTARYIIGSGDGAGVRDGEIAILWLKAMGIDAVVVGGPNTTGAYKDFLNPKKFDGVLEKVWHEGDDSIFLVPQRTASLARVMLRGDLAPRAPVNGIDIAPLIPYVAALDNPELPYADFAWTSRHSAAIIAMLRPEHVVSIQIAYHPGWHARVNGAPGKLEEDGIGHMFIQPHCSGPCVIQLAYDGGREMHYAHWAAGIAWSLAILVLLWQAKVELYGKSR